MPYFLPASSLAPDTYWSKSKFILWTRHDFETLLNSAGNSEFKPKSIEIYKDIGLTNSDLQQLVDALMRNPSAKKSFSDLHIQGNQSLTELPDLSAFKLISLRVTQCGLEAAPDISRYVDLENIFLHWLTPGVLDLSRNVRLKEIRLYDAPLTAAPDLTNNPRLKSIVIIKCGLTSPPIVDSCPDLVKLDLRTNQLRSLPNLANNLKIERIDVSENKIEEICDISFLTRLTWLLLHNNRLRKIPELPKFLEALYAYKNAITDASNVQSCANLRHLYLDVNYIASALDLSKCKKLKRTDFSYNPLLTLGARVILMRYRPKNAILDVPFTLVEPPFWDNRHTDFKLLARLYRKLPADKQESIRERSDFELYKLRYFSAILEVLKVTKQLEATGFSEVAVWKKIASYCIESPLSWIVANMEMFSKLFANNPDAVAVIYKYAMHYKKEHNRLVNQIIAPQLREVATRAKIAANRITLDENQEQHLRCDMPDRLEPYKPSRSMRAVSSLVQRFR